MLAEQELQTVLSSVAMQQLRGVAQVAECPNGKHNALRSNPTPTKRQKKQMQ
jgi:hypothetical protein